MLIVLLCIAVITMTVMGSYVINRIEDWRRRSKLKARCYSIFWKPGSRE